MRSTIAGYRGVLGMELAPYGMGLSDDVSEVARKIRSHPAGSVIRTPSIQSNATPLSVGNKRTAHTIIAASPGFKVSDATRTHEMFHGKGGLHRMLAPHLSKDPERILARSEAGAQLAEVKSGANSFRGAFLAPRSHGIEFSSHPKNRFSLFGTNASNIANPTTLKTGSIPSPSPAAAHADVVRRALGQKAANKVTGRTIAYQLSRRVPR